MVAESPAVKQQWLRDVNQTIVNCKKRENIINEGTKNRRMSILGRIESQHEMEKMERDATSPEKIGKGNGARRHSYRHNHANHNPPSPSAGNRSMIEEDCVDEAYQAVPFALNDELQVDSTEANIHTFPEISLPESGDSEQSTSETPVLPTAEERAQRQQEGIETFNNVVNTLSEDSLNSLFSAVSKFLFLLLFF